MHDGDAENNAKQHERRTDQEGAVPDSSQIHVAHLTVAGSAWWLVNSGLAAAAGTR